MPNPRSQPPISLLLFGSGLCALVYQTVWLREFRLIFGASTAASAAVLGIFMAGLGLGSAVLGRRAEATRRPLEYYAKLEILIACSAALTPFLLSLIRMAYTATGGSAVLGQTGATAVRIVLSLLVLCVPTFLMGGTLPAAARAAETDEDQGRRRLAFLYGCNTLGAVMGATLATFYFIEQLGNRQTLWFACGLNLLVAMIARGLGRGMPDISPSSTAASDAQASPAVSHRFVMIAAAGVGWAFMLMELVWYRMLGPILGGSTFTFGLILAVALFGIGVGGGLYALLRANKQPTAQAFAATCALEALFIAIPFALGDRVALLALQLRELSIFGFGGHLIGWIIITSIVILPAALVAGYQFPMLIALLGRGREDVGRHTGLAYAANTVGAIVGSLAGGFGLMPLLGAIGAWKLVVVTLVMLAIAAMVVGLRGRERLQWRSSLAGAIAVLLLFATGPTAFWRHGGIGAGRLNLRGANTNQLQDSINSLRRHIVWEVDGVESSVGLAEANAYAFVVNGKSDGNSRADMGTQVMAGLVGALLHPDPKRVMVIGLGTGSTAGWLGAIPSVERVDVAELEGAILRIAEVCSPVNENVLKNPKVKIDIGDAREALLTTRERYDLIFSEPSNPYRAGIASLFSLEFYQAASERLAPGGFFLQWVQTYDIDSEALHTVYATLGSVFPHVDTWYTSRGDLLLVASRESIAVDVEQLRSRVAAEPYRRALGQAWSVNSAEGFLEHFIAGPDFARLCKDSNAPVCTDDRNYLEFGFARGVGRGKIGDWAEDMRHLARERKWHRPTTRNGTIDWEKVDAQKYSQRARLGMPTEADASESPAMAARRQFVNQCLGDRLSGAAEIWKKAPFEALNPLEAQLIAMSLIAVDDPGAAKFIEMVRQFRPMDANAIEVQAKSRNKNWPEAVALLEKVFENWRVDPWVDDRLLEKTLETAVFVSVSAGDAALSDRLYRALQKPLAVHMQEKQRLRSLLVIAAQSGPKATEYVADVFNQVGIHPLWNKQDLATRVKNYRAINHGQLAQAEADLVDFMNREPADFQKGLPVPAREPAPLQAVPRPKIAEDAGNAPAIPPTLRSAEPGEN